MEPVVRQAQSEIANKRERYNNLMRETIAGGKLMLPRLRDTSHIVEEISEADICPFISKQEPFNQSLIPGMLFQLVVIGKDDKTKQVSVYVWKHKGEVWGCKYLGLPLDSIGCYKLKGIIKDYESQDFSVFGYCDSYKTMQSGQLLLGKLLRTIKRQEEIVYEFSLRNTLNSVKDDPILGILDYRADEEAVMHLRNQGVLSIDYQLSHNREFKNPHFYESLVQSMRIRRWDTLNYKSNKPIFFDLGLHYQRLICQQIEQDSEHSKSTWSKQYFRDGLALTKQYKPHEAIERFNQAIKIDATNPDIYVAKGCALANLKNYSDGLKQLQTALQIDPNHKEARRYYEELSIHLKSDSDQPLDYEEGAIK